MTGKSGDSTGTMGMLMTGNATDWFAEKSTVFPQKMIYEKIVDNSAKPHWIGLYRNILSGNHGFSCHV